ncbi:MAG: TIGR02147 family protein [Chitinivibrionales bacterium]|nr:TIGR02147 family protein [Chitinivibrionales bacterium]
MVNIYEYHDYRQYLRDYFAERKRTHKGFSHRAFLQKLEISSSGFLSNVMAGRSNLTTHLLHAFSRALNLSKTESAYFETMVLFTQAKTLEEKTEYFNRLVDQQRAKLKVLNETQLSLFSKWHYAIVRELLTVIEFDGDYARLTRLLDPPISVAQAREAVTVLEKIGLIARDDDGIYRNTADDIVSTGDTPRSFEVRQFNAETIKQARRALERVPPDEREIATLTVTLSPDSFEQIRQEIRQFRKRLLKIARTERAPDHVAQININLFPVTARERTD